MGKQILNICLELKSLKITDFLMFLKLRNNPARTDIACNHGINWGRNRCHGVLAVPKKSHPHPKGSDKDCIINVMFTKSIGMTNAIQLNIPKGSIDPAYS